MGRAYEYVESDLGQKAKEDHGFPSVRQVFSRRCNVEMPEGVSVSTGPHGVLRVSLESHFSASMPSHVLSTACYAHEGGHRNGSHP